MPDVPTTRKEHREALASRLEASWKAMLELYTYWDDNDLPSDVLYHDEFPFDVALEEQLARMAASVERIRAHNDLDRVEPPDFDTVSALGFDGTLRGEDGRDVGQDITWEDVDARLKDRRGPTMTAGEIRAALANVPDERPVLAYGAMDYLNIKSVDVPNPAEEMAAVLNTMNDFDERQW